MNRYDFGNERYLMPLQSLRRPPKDPLVHAILGHPLEGALNEIGADLDADPTVELALTFRSFSGRGFGAGTVPGRDLPPDEALERALDRLRESDADEREEQLRENWRLAALQDRQREAGHDDAFYGAMVRIPDDWTLEARRKAQDRWTEEYRKRTTPKERRRELVVAGSQSAASALRRAIGEVWADVDQQRQSAQARAFRELLSGDLDWSEVERAAGRKGWSSERVLAYWARVRKAIADLVRSLRREGYVERVSREARRAERRDAGKTVDEVDWLRVYPSYLLYRSERASLADLPEDATAGEVAALFTWMRSDQGLELTTFAQKVGIKSLSKDDATRLQRLSRADG